MRVRAKNGVCRRCNGDYYDPVEKGRRCIRCNGTNEDPEHIAVDVDALCMATLMRRPARVVPLFQRGEPQRARQTTPSNAPSPKQARARAYRMLAVVAVVAFVLGYIAGRAS